MRNLLWPKKIHPACSRERIGPRPRAPSTSDLGPHQLHVVQELLLLLCHNDEEQKGAPTGRKLWTARRKGARQREMWTGTRRDSSPATGDRSDHEDARFRGGQCWRELSECYVHVIMGRGRAYYAYVHRGGKKSIAGRGQAYAYVHRGGKKSTTGAEKNGSSILVGRCSRALCRTNSPAAWQEI